MIVYQFNLPALSNDGRKNYERERREFVGQCIDKAGGASELPSQSGSWRDNGTLYRDTVYPVQVACDAPTYRSLLADAMRLFPDQLAIYVVEIGQAWIERRADVAA